MDEDEERKVGFLQNLAEPPLIFLFLSFNLKNQIEFDSSVILKEKKKMTGKANVQIE